MKRISIDCKSLETVCGVAVYTRELLRKLIPLDGGITYQLLLRSKESYPGEADNLERRRVWIPGRIMNFIWKKWSILPLDLFLGRVDVYFSPNFTLPYLRPRVKTVITVHDLAFMKMPENMTSATNAFLSHWVRYSINRADHIISVSECTKSDIVELFGVDEKRISVVYSGCNETFRLFHPTAGQVSALRAKYHLPARFILYHGTLEPRKNLPMLLKAYASAKDRLGGIKLVLSGRKGWLYEGIFSAVKELGLSEDVFFPGFIEDEDLPLLYNQCEFFTFVSKYEGFGLPVLEAMACGKAVIVSDVSSLPEVVGNAGCKVPTDDWEALAGAMVRLAGDDAFRKGLETACLDRSKVFSWDAAARETMDILLKAAAGKAKAAQTATAQAQTAPR